MRFIHARSSMRGALSAGYFACFREIFKKGWPTQAFLHVVVGRIGSQTCVVNPLLLVRVLISIIRR